MKYLKWDRPPVPPCTADLMRYFYPDRGYMTDVGGIVRLMNEDGTLDEEGFTTTEDEWETVLQLMNEEWEEWKKMEEVRNSLPDNKILFWNLWKDMDSGVIPGKGGEFHKVYGDAIAKYSEGQDSLIYPFDDYK